MTLRVEGGEARGRRLSAPRGIRPTQGLVKGAIFNMLGQRVMDAVVLDLYAGSGALGIEALSRGASSATFVERSTEAVSALQRNLEALGYSERGRVVRAALPRWLGSAAGRAAVQAASLVLVDPPYADPGLEAVLSQLGEHLPPGALVVAEHASGREPAAPGRLEVLRSRRHGGTSVTIARAADR